jgi:cell wall-associated NlpC family hydrolase
VRKLFWLAVMGIAAMFLMVLPLGLAAGGSATADTSSTAAGTAGLNPVLAQAYQQAATRAPQLVPACTGMTWQILAGVAQVESNQAAGHTIAADGEITPPIIGPALDGSGTGGNTTAVHDHAGYAHALGPFQFMPATWAADGLNARGTATAPDVQNAFDASLTAAVYLCGKGRDLTQATQLHDALYSYNHSEAYVAQVQAAITKVQQLPAATATVPASGRAAVVIAAALAERGIPYSWGGGNAHGPTRGICCSQGGQDGSKVVGFDCSGLTLYAYAQAGVTLPRLAADQAGVGRRIPASAGLSALRPGDLIFFGLIPGDDASIYHVAIYQGGGMMLEAPRPSENVKSAPVWSYDYAGGAAIL